MPIKKNTPGCASCPCSGGGGGIPVGGTCCPAIPATLTLSASSGNSQNVPSATLQYGSPPGAIAAGYAPGHMWWYSPTSFMDPFGFTYYLTFSCSFSLIHLLKSYVNLPGSPPGTEAAICVRWIIGSGPPNNCSPFDMTAVSFDTTLCGAGGIPPTDVITLSG